jgi:hypothetical protein
MDSSKKEEIRLRRRRIISVIIILILIHIILNLIRVNVKREEMVNKSIPYIDYEEYETKEPEITELCFEKEFDWIYQWSGWNEDKEGYVSPIFKLTNLENETGEFTVEFAFFDNAIYDYDAYHGKPYETVEERLPWEAAAMHSYLMKERVNPGQEVVFNSYTKKKNTGSSYWAYADVDVPIHKVCNYTTEYINVTRNRTVTRYRDEEVSKEVTRSITLWQLLVDFIKNR